MGFLFNYFEQHLPKNTEISTIQLITPSQTDYSVELREIERSGARIVIVIVAETQSESLCIAAHEYGIISDEYVRWASGDTFTLVRFIDDEGNPKTETINAFSGVLAPSVIVSDDNEKYRAMIAHYAELNITGEVLDFLGPVGALYYDAGWSLVEMFLTADEKGLLPDDHSFATVSGKQWYELGSNLDFDGASGRVKFDDEGFLASQQVGISNFIANDVEWVQAGVLETATTEIIFSEDVVWYDRTTNIPDLDIRPPFSYWSCHKKESGYDSTGKTIMVETPDGSDVDYIDSTYYCDGFIDCENLSDERGGCWTNYTIVFIVYGIITGLLMVILIGFFVFTLIFSCCFRRIRLQASSPLFLLLLLCSCFLGYISVFAWYGKPHPVVCGFQPWLLGLGAVGMISALCAKTFRVWRVFAIPFKRVTIKDWELIIFWVVMVIPALFILIVWTIVSTPTAKMIEKQGEDHYMCATGGFTEEPGGLVFFFILVGYEGILLLFAAFLTFVTRNVPQMFNESTLLAISIYNLTFLAVVVIPVYFVLIEINPFIAWLVRTTAVIYAFTATLWMQFLPMVVGVVIVDKCKKVALNPNMLQGLNTDSSSMTMKQQSSTSSNPN